MLVNLLLWPHFMFGQLAFYGLHLPQETMQHAHTLEILMAVVIARIYSPSRTSSGNTCRVSTKIESVS